MTASHIFEFEEDGRLLPRGSDLTDEQLAALDLERHIVVTAGAGSGKTRTLSRRVLRILGEFAWRAAVEDPSQHPRGPRNLLVSTFTERAAAELQERIREELLLGIREMHGRMGELNDDPRLQPGTADKILEHLRNSHRDLGEARIGTFHGFCAATLREFSAAIGLDPGFAILQGPEYDKLLSTVVDDSLNAIESSPPPDSGTHDPHLVFRPVFRAFNRRQLTELLESWIKRRGELKAFAEVLDGHDNEQLLERWLACYAQVDLDALEAATGPDSTLHGQLCEAHELEEFYTGAPDNRPPLLDAVVQALDIAAQQPPSSIEDRAERLASYLGLFLKGDGGLRKVHHSWTGKKMDFGADHEAALAGLWRPLRDQLAQQFGEEGELLATLPARADRLGLPVLRALTALATEVVRSYQRRKAQDALLDFTDLELEVLSLLREQPAALARLQARFEHLLVDEFQDTNAVQWNIVKLLANTPTARRGLFLVGDPKQAIYRFRGGDVTLFDRATAEVRRAGGEELRFSANFRSRKALISTFNHLFAWLMPGDEPDRLPWEAPFTELSAERRLEDGDDDCGAVEMMWLSADGGGELSNDESEDTPASMALNPLLAAAMPLGREAAMVAARLRDHHLPAVSEHKGIKAAILLRRRTHLPAYAFALRQAGVPHVVARGRGFFARQEVLDVANLLLALAHPDDVIALIGALRGPFLGLEDAWLLWLAKTGSPSGYRAVRYGWDRCLSKLLAQERETPDGWDELPADGQLAIKAAAQQFDRWRRLRSRLPLSAFLREVLFSSGAFHLFTLGDPSGQARANVEKLLSLAAGYDTRGAEGLADFALFLREQEEAQTDEGEASIDAAAPVVVMTIHQSKGLEFPIVVLPDLQQALCRTDNSALACSRLGERWNDEDLWEVGLRVPVEDGQRTMEPMVLRTLIQRRSRQEELAESRRLLYVAMTRARDRLICISRAPQKAAERPRGLERSTTWEEWLRSWLASGGDQLVSVFNGMQAPDGMEYVDGSNGDGRETLPRPEDLAPLPACAAPILTPHSLTDDNPAITASTGRSSRPVGDHGALGKMRGLLVHSCLEDSVYRPGEATEQRIKYTLARAGMLSEDHVSWLRDELSHHLSGFRRAAPEALLGEEQGAVFRELPFRLPLPPPNQGQSGEGGWLEGVIDLLYRDEQQQRWIVVDYKSDKAPPEVLVDKYRSQLLAYAWAVSCILPELSDPQWTVETQLLFTAHGERRTVSGPATRSEIENQFRDLLSTQP